MEGPSSGYFLITYFIMLTVLHVCLCCFIHIPCLPDDMTKNTAVKSRERDLGHNEIIDTFCVIT